MSNAPEEISSLAGNIQPSNPVPAKRGVYRRSLSLEQSQNIKVAALKNELKVYTMSLSQ